MGCAPIPEDDFDSLLRGAGLEIYQPGEHTTVLVIGQEGWNSQDINALLDARSGKTLRAYSQEMFRAYLISGEDPLDDPETARHLAGDHPGLAFLTEVGFDWPTTRVGQRTGGEMTDLKAESYLMRLGYSTRRGGPDVQKRRRILSFAYQYGEVPGVFDDSYIASWGTPRSAARLRQIAVTIAANCTRFKKHRKNHRRSPQAIEKWETDLSWLRRNFYDGKFKFSWPDTKVW